MSENIKVVNELLGYEKIKIIQCPNMFNFSIDSILLANFCTVNKKFLKIVDFCSGNGPIPLYLTLRTKSKIIGIEIQEDVFNLAKESISINNLDNQIEILNMDVKEVDKLISNVDLVTCNPPYFKYQEDSKINKNNYLTIARHEVEITLEEIIQKASIILKNGGYFSMVHRADRLEEIFELFKKYKIAIKKIRFVYPKENSKCNHLLIEGIKNGKPGLKVLSPLYIYDSNNKWTEEIIKIYNYKE